MRDIGTYPNNKAAAEAIRILVFSTERFAFWLNSPNVISPEEKRIALALADSLEGAIFEGYSVRWYLPTIIKEMESVIGKEEPLSVLFADTLMALAVCYSYYISPLLPDDELNDEEFEQIVPIFLSNDQWTLIDSFEEWGNAGWPYTKI